MDFSADCADLEKHYVDGTRQWLFDQVSDWVNTNTKDSVLWLNAVAGVGKSVAASKLTSILRGKNQLVTSLFLKYNDVRKSDPRVVLSTISYGLCQWYSPIGRRLLQAHHKKTDLGDLAIGDLFQALIVKPLEALGNYKPNGSVVIIVDALDECFPRDELLSLLAWRFVELNKARPWLKLLLTSRPEADIAAAFEGVLTKEIQPSSEDNVSDLRVYIRHRLGELSEVEKEKAADTILYSRRLNLERQQKGSEKQNQQQQAVSADSAKTFVWINLILNTVDERRKSTVITLQVIKDVNDSASNISELYAKTFSKIYAQSSNKKMLVTLLSALVTSQTILTPAMIRNLFFSQRDEMEAHRLICEGLMSFRLVLAGDVAPEDPHQPVKFNHKSVADYLLSDDSKMEHFHVSPEFHLQFAKACLSLMLRHEPMINLCGISDFHDNIPDLHERVEKRISPSLRYSVGHWITHFVWCLDPAKETSVSWETVESLGVADVLSEFLHTHALFWLECASLTQVVYSVIQRTAVLLQRLSVKIPVDVSHPEEPTQGKDSGAISIMVNDIYRFLREFGSAIVVSAPQVYQTGFFLLPRNTRLYETYKSTVEPHLPYAVSAGLAAQWDQCEMTLPGQGWVGAPSVAISPDGLLLACGGYRTIRIWDAVVGKLLHTLEGPENGSYMFIGVSFVSGGKRIAAVREDTIFVWDVLTGQVLHSKSCEVPGKGYRLKSPAFTLDGRWLACSFGKYEGDTNILNSVYVFDFQTGKLMRQFGGHTDGVTAITPSPDGKIIASGSMDKTVKVWDMTTEQVIHTLEGHSSEISQVVYSFNGQLLATASDSTSSEIIIWDALTGQMVQTLQNGAAFISLSFDGARLVSSLKGEPIKLWDTTSGELVQELTDTPYVKTLALFRDGSRLASLDNIDGTIKVWDADVPDGMDETIEGHASNGLFVKLSPDGRWVVSTYSDLLSEVRGVKECYVWDAQTGKPSGWLKFSRSCEVLQISPDGTKILYNDDGALVLWDHLTGERRKVGEQLLRFSIQDGALEAVFSPDGQSVAVEMYKDDLHHVDIIRIDTGKVVETFEGHEDTVTFMTYSTDGRWLGAIFGHVIYVYNVDSAEVIVINAADPDGGYPPKPRRLAFSPDGQTLTSGHNNGELKVWNFRQGGLVETLPNSDDRPISGIEYSLDGQCLAFENLETSPNIWDGSLRKFVKAKMGSRFSRQSKSAFYELSPDGWIWSNIGSASSQWWSDGDYVFQMPGRFCGFLSPFTTNGVDFKVFTNSLPCRLVNILVSFMSVNVLA
jgi:WD40 repeat protein